MECKKVKHKSKKCADKHIEDMHTGKEYRYYLCPNCNHWHITSQKKK